MPHPPIEPLKPAFRVRSTTDAQLNMLQEATLTILEDVGVRFPSKKALDVFAAHGAQVNRDTEVVKIPPDLVKKAMASAPRYFHLGARNPADDLQLQYGVTYFTTDGCGFETIDFETRQRRPSCKADVERMALIADYLSAIAFYYPMVSAQDYGLTAPLHEMDAAWNNTVKHVLSVTIMGEMAARYALEMATVIAGSREEVRRRPPLSLVVCTIAPLMQDRDGIEGAMFLAQAGIPVGFMAMPTMGTTAPATLAGALSMADAEVISAVVLMQLVAPGAPIFHSIMHAWADPRNGAYIGYSLDSRGRCAAVEMAHRWNIPSFGGAYGTDSKIPGTWQAAAEVAFDPLLMGLSGAEFVTGMGLSETYTVLYPEQIILDADIYHRARYTMMSMDVSDETLALETVRAVGPGGHFLAQKHTRTHMRESMKMAVTHELDADGKYRDPVQVAREKVDWILKNHHSQPLDKHHQAELKRILAAAEREFCVEG